MIAWYAGEAEHCQSIIIYLLKENMDLVSGVCFLVTEDIQQVYVSHQNLHRLIYTHQNFSDCFGLAIWKRSAKEDDWAQLPVTLILTYKHSCVFAFGMWWFDSDRQHIALNKIIILGCFD